MRMLAWVSLRAADRASLDAVGLVVARDGSRVYSVRPALEHANWSTCCSAKWEGNQLLRA